MQFGNFKTFFILFFFTSLGFSQSLEDQIYDAIDVFVKNILDNNKSNNNSMSIMINTSKYTVNTDHNDHNKCSCKKFSGGNKIIITCSMNI